MQEADQLQAKGEINSLVPCPFQWIPISRILEAARIAGAGINRWVDRRILAGFGVAVGENGDAEISVSDIINALKALAGARGAIHARVRPPATRTPHAVGLGRRVANEKIVRRAFDR